MHPQILLAVEQGDLAPDFSVAALRADDIRAGRTVSLSHFRGKVVYLDFWDSSCAPCRESLPALEVLSGHHRAESIAIVAVNLDSDPDQGRRFLERYPVSFPMGSDPSSLIATDYGLRALPTAFIIGRDGVIRHIHTGAADINRISSELSALAVDG